MTVYSSSSVAPDGGPGATGPGTTNKGKARLARFRALPGWRKTLIIAGVLLLIGATGSAAAAFGLVHRYESRVKHEDLLGDAAVPKNEERWKAGPLNLLLLGSDSRAGEREEGKFAGERSDAIMLVHISADRSKAAIISIPRDSYVDIPADGTWKGGKNKLNAAFAHGGSALTAKTVSQLTGVPLDGAMIANFAGIRTMVDAVGRVNVCVPYDVDSSFSDRFWKKGCHEMDGAEAEEFMRQRMNVPGGDFGRMHDQQLVVKAIIEKVAAAGVLSNPLTFDKLLLTAAGALTIDKSLDLRELAMTVRDIRPASVQFATVPHRNPGLKTSAGSAVELDPQKAPALFQAIRSDAVEQWLAANPAPTKPA
ncbi:MAG TPA: LCP family protein [Micromonosporaceae bacterium]|nr:LCP family protein [Micromonosporaceae bacterium]